MQEHLPHPVSALIGASTLGVVLLALGAQSVNNVRPILTLTPEEKEILSHLSVVYLDDGQGGQAKTIRYTGVNVQLVNGLGATNGYPTNPLSRDPGLTQTNGVGNLILGYHEDYAIVPGDRTGSHNLSLGYGNNFSSFGGTAVGLFNSIEGPYASCSGGMLNQATGEMASVSGGMENVACGFTSSVSGGTWKRSGGNPGLDPGRLLQ